MLISRSIYLRTLIHNATIYTIMDGHYYLHSETAEVERPIGEDEDRHSVISASSTESSVDPVGYEVESIASSVEERLT